MFVKMKLTVFIVFACSLASQALRHTLPDNFPKCKCNDTKLEECLLNATEIVRPFLVTGIRDLRVPPIEPLRIPAVVFETDNTISYSFKARLSDIDVHGLSNYKFSRFHFDVAQRNFFCELEIAPLLIQGRYEGKGELFSVSTEAQGQFTAGISKVYVYSYQEIDFIEKNGEEYLHLTFSNTSIQVDDPKIDLDNLFGENEQLNKLSNKFIQSNVDMLFKELKPTIEKVIGVVIDDLLYKAFFDNIPFKDLYFPPDNFDYDKVVPRSKKAYNKKYFKYID